MPRAKKKVEEVVVVEETIEEVKAEQKTYVVATKLGYALNVRNLATSEVVRTIANGSPITVIKIEDGKAILNDNEYVVADLVKEVG